MDDSVEAYGDLPATPAIDDEPLYEAPPPPRASASGIIDESAYGEAPPPRTQPASPGNDDDDSAYGLPPPELVERARQARQAKAGGGQGRPRGHTDEPVSGGGHGYGPAPAEVIEAHRRRKQMGGGGGGGGGRTRAVTDQDGPSPEALAAAAANAARAADKHRAAAGNRRGTRGGGGGGGGPGLAISYEQLLADTTPPSTPLAGSYDLPAQARSGRMAEGAAVDPRFVIDYKQVKLERTIGAGQYGVVHVGQWRSFRVAVKEARLPPASEASAATAAAADFRSEAVMLTQLRPHPNITKLYGVSLEPLAIVSEYMELGALDRWLAQQPKYILFARILNIMTGIAKGVAHLHQEGIVHRDLAARNVLLDSKLTPKLTDFGLSRRAAPPGQLTQTVSTVGQPLKWMAPEQLHRQSRYYSPRSDVWAFGVICYECMTQELPWDELSMTDAAVRTLNGERLSMPERTPPFLDELVRACWTTNPNLRPAMRDLVVALSEACDAVGPPPAVAGSFSPAAGRSMAGSELPRTGATNPIDRSAPPPPPPEESFESENYDALGAPAPAAAPRSAAASSRPGSRSLAMSVQDLQSGPPEIDPDTIDLRDAPLLGAGTYGEVFKGKCAGQTVAVKVPSRQNLSPKQLEEFRHEVAVMKRIFSPHVTLFLGASTRPGRIMLVSEYLSGGDLEHLLHSQRELPFRLRLRFAGDMCRAMAWLHDISHIVHRDLKPANLLLDENLRLKVTDFGFSQLRPSHTAMMDEKGPKGSALWMAPEVFNKEQFDEKIDVYAFGLILWELLTRQWLFPQYSQYAEFKHAICVERVRPVIPQYCGPLWARTMRECWAHEPQRRPAFRDMVSRCDELTLECVLSAHPPGASRFWRERYFAPRTQLEQSVGWDEFYQALCRGAAAGAANPAVAQAELLSLKDVLEPVLAQDARAASKAAVEAGGAPVPGCDDDEASGRRVVTLGHFADCVNWFGTIYDHPNPLRFAALLARQPWFHGAIDRLEAERRLVNRIDGTFLVRLSSNKPQHPMTVSVVKQGAVFQHKRIKHEHDAPDSNWYVPVDGRTECFASLAELISAPMCKLRTACPRSDSDEPSPYDYEDTSIYEKKRRP